MYDPATGLANDGIEPNSNINRNSGAESVISALLGLMEVLQSPVASEYLRDEQGNTVTLLKSLSGLPDAGRLPLRGQTAVVQLFAGSGRLLSERSCGVRMPELWVPVPRYGYAVVEASPHGSVVHRQGTKDTRVKRNRGARGRGGEQPPCPRPLGAAVAGCQRSACRDSRSGAGS